MKSKLIKELHSVNIYRHPVNRKKLEVLKTSEIINIWYDYFNKPNETQNEEQLATEEA
ncbi:MAG: hypothetical protein ACRDA3_03050 [Peptostreptococcaceae bacterium]